MASNLQFPLLKSGVEKEDVCRPAWGRGRAPSVQSRRLYRAPDHRPDHAPAFSRPAPPPSSLATAASCRDWRLPSTVWWPRARKVWNKYQYKLSNPLLLKQNFTLIFCFLENGSIEIDISLKVCNWTWNLDKTRKWTTERGELGPWSEKMRKDQNYYFYTFLLPKMCWLLCKNFCNTIWANL